MFSALTLGAYALASVALGVAGAPPLQSSMPDKSWLGVRKILIVTDFVSGQVLLPELNSESICRRVQAIAAAGAPGPVACTHLGDPNLASGGTAVLVVQAAVSDNGPGEKILIFTARRADEHGLEPAVSYLGATPRAVTFKDNPDEAKLDRLIRASLGQLLPWLPNHNMDQQSLIKRGRE